MNKIISSAAALGAIALLALPALSFAQVYYYSSGNSYGSYNGAYSYIPASAMPYVEYGNQMAQQEQQQYEGYSSYSYPTQYQSQSQEQSQSQYQTSYPSYNYYNSTPTYTTSSNTGEFAKPNSVSYPSGTYGPFGTPLCYWSDYPTYAPCNQDPQQWIQDPYTGEWY